MKNQNPQLSKTGPFDKNFSQEEKKSASNQTSQQQNAMEKVLQKTQKITQLRPFSTLNFSNLQTSTAKKSVSLQPYLKLIVENVYLMQALYLLKQSCHMGIHFYNIRNEVVQYYVPSQQVQKLSPLHKSIIKQQFQYLSLDKSEGSIRIFFERICSLIRNIKNHEFFENKTKNQEIHQLQQLERAVKMCLQEPKLKRLEHLMKFLEQTQIFREQSMLVKLTNSSLYFKMQFYEPKNFENLTKTVKQCLKTSQNLEEKLNDSEIAFKIDRLFGTLCQKKLIEINKSSNSSDNGTVLYISVFQMKDKNSSFEYMELAVKFPTRNFSAINSDLLLAIINEKSIQNCQVIESNKKSKIQCTIIYFFADRLLIYRIMCTAEVLSENIDNIYLKINQINEQSPRVKFRIVNSSKSQLQNKKEKRICLQIGYQFQGVEEPLIKVLELIEESILVWIIFKGEFEREKLMKPYKFDLKQVLDHYWRLLIPILKIGYRKFIV